MVLNGYKRTEQMLKDWEKEFLAGHRWGRLKAWFPKNHFLDDDTVISKLTHLRTLWNKIQPLDDACENILKSILALEICNWNLEESILNICKAIGEKRTPTIPIGHLNSITSERWKRLWAYYLALRNWLLFQRINSYEVLQNLCDPGGLVMRKISIFLGERNQLKELYVERFCLLFEFWLGGYTVIEKKHQLIAHNAAVKAIEEEILKEDPENDILVAMKFEGDGRLQPCNHKAFRRYDIIISSIGSGKWRAAMPRRGTDGLERADLLDKYLLVIESWIENKKDIDEYYIDDLYKKIYSLLRDPDETKTFLATLLVSLLRPQQMAAKQLAEKRIKNFEKPEPRL